MWNDNEASGTKETLYRIALHLLSLAGLAGQAATVPMHRRRLALFILRNGELTAWDLLSDLFSAPQLAFDEYWDAVISDEPEDAMLLSARLRLLAFAVYHMASCFSSPARGTRWPRFVAAAQPHASPLVHHIPARRASGKSYADSS